MSGPRRGQIDAQNRLWAAEFYAGQVVMFDPDKQQLKEYPLIEGTKPYTAPYAEPYSASVDDKNHIVWTNDFSSSRIYKIDTDHGKVHRVYDAVELRDPRFQSGSRCGASDRVDPSLPPAIKAGEGSGALTCREPPGTRMLSCVRVFGS